MRRTKKAYALTTRERVTWHVLRDAAGRQGICRLSVEEIAERTGFSRRTVQAHLQKIELVKRCLTVKLGNGRGRKSCRIVPRFFSYEAWEDRGFVRGYDGRLVRRQRVQKTVPLYSSSCTEERPNQKARSVPGSEATRGDRDAHHAPAKPLRLVERDVETIESVDALWRRLCCSGWVEATERFREIVHGLVHRARRVAQNVLAFVAGVVRKGYWRCVGERDREAARDDIRALTDTAVVAAAPVETFDLSALWAAGVERLRMAPDPKQVGNLYSQRMAAPRPSRIEDEHAQAEAEKVQQGRYVYGMVVQDRLTLAQAGANLGIPDHATVRELGAKYAKASGCEEPWSRAVARLQDRDVGASPTSKFGQMRQAQAAARSQAREAGRGGEPKATKDLLGPVFWEARK